VVRLGHTPGRDQREYKYTMCDIVPLTLCPKLYTVGPSPPTMLAKISRDINAVRLELTTQAIQAGLLEASVVSTVLFQSGQNFD
jgi:hypothetical protein